MVHWQAIRNKGFDLALDWEAAVAEATRGVAN
jgi:hypothetical protein